jgi:hypothetical protein
VGSTLEWLPLSAFDAAIVLLASYILCSNLKTPTPAARSVLYQCRSDYVVLAKHEVAATDKAVAVLDQLIPLLDDATVSNQGFDAKRKLVQDILQNQGRLLPKPAPAADHVHPVAQQNTPWPDMQGAQPFLLDLSLA